MIKVFLGFERNNISPGADYNAELLDISLLKYFRSSFSRWYESIELDNMACPANAAHGFSKHAKQNLVP